MLCPPTRKCHVLAAASWLDVAASHGCAHVRVGSLHPIMPVATKVLALRLYMQRLLPVLEIVGIVVIVTFVEKVFGFAVKLDASYSRRRCSSHLYIRFGF